MPPPLPYGDFTEKSLRKIGAGSYKENADAHFSAFIYFAFSKTDIFFIVIIAFDE